MSYQDQLQQTIQEHTNLNQQILELEVQISNMKERRSRLVGRIELLHELTQLEQKGVNGDGELSKELDILPSD